ncbi:MAG TPA: M24 family metallopeptidase [bacterium]|nr:M24 family metallopeptidase [bacterium]
MVRMASKLTFGTAAADWQERINVIRMREERAERARKVMRKHGIPVILAARPDNTRYLTSLRGPEFMPQLWYALFFAEHDPVIFEHAGWHSQLPREVPWIKHWRVARSWLGGAPGAQATANETKQFAAEVRQELQERGLAGEKLGFVGLDGLARQALSDAGITTVDAGPLMLEARAVKTVDEITCMKTVANICEAGWYKAWQTLRPGIRDTEISPAVVATIYEAGADESPPITFHSGPTSFDRGFNRSGRLLQHGDLAYTPMCGVTYLGYRSCTYRTFIVGRKPNDREKDWYKSLLHRIDSVIDCIKPGATTADAAKHFPPATSWGYKEEAEVLTMEIGHGIGLFQYEYPIINRQWSLENPQVFEAGMIVAVEGREGDHRMGGVRLENMLVVTENGAEIIDHFPREEILQAPL